MELRYPLAKHASVHTYIPQDTVQASSKICMQQTKFWHWQNKLLPSPCSKFASFWLPGCWHNQHLSLLGFFSWSPWLCTEKHEAVAQIQVGQYGGAFTSMKDDVVNHVPFVFGVVQTERTAEIFGSFLRNCWMPSFHMHSKSRSVNTGSRRQAQNRTKTFW